MLTWLMMVTGTSWGEFGVWHQCFKSWLICSCCMTLCPSCTSESQFPMPGMFVSQLCKILAPFHFSSLRLKIFFSDQSSLKTWLKDFPCYSPLQPWLASFLTWHLYYTFTVCFLLRSVYPHSTTCRGHRLLGLKFTQARPVLTHRGHQIILPTLNENIWSGLITILAIPDHCEDYVHLAPESN